MKASFKHYVSLGENCEGAFQIRRILGRDSSSFFSWNITSADSLIKILRNRFEGVMEAPNLRRHGDGSLVHDCSYGYKFHSAFPKHEGIDFALYPEILSKHREKALYLIKKFIDICESGESVAFFFKTSEHISADVSLEILSELKNISNSGSNLALIIIRSDEFLNDNWAIPGIHARYLKRIAPWYDATDGHVHSWDRIFEEFPHEEPLRLSGY